MRGMFLLLALILMAPAFAQTPTEKEKAIFANITDFASQGYKYDSTSKYEKYTKTVFAKKSIEWDYTFRCSDPNKQPLVIQQSIATEPTEKDADNTYEMDAQNAKDVLGKELTYTTQADFYPCGKRWDFMMLYKNNTPVGFVYHYQKGRYTASLLVIGPYFDDADAFKEFMEPLVKRTDEGLRVLGLL